MLAYQAYNSYDRGPERAQLQLICKIKGDAATKQGFIIEGDICLMSHAGFVGEGSHRSIVVSFLAPMNNALGVKKSYWCLISKQPILTMTRMIPP
jgi:hypothetical protein